VGNEAVKKSIQISLLSFELLYHAVRAQEGFAQQLKT
jgi:hypothetical protein